MEHHYRKLLLEKFEAEKKFEKELAQSQIEIQEQTLKNIAWELHDNIGQLLSVANMQLAMIIPTSDEAIKPHLEETKTTIASSVQELRALSRNLNNEVVLNNGLVKSMENELERFDRLKFLNTHFSIKGTPQLLKSDVEIILFRIFQEFISNVMKHSRAKNLFVTLSFEEKYLSIESKDDGVGFDVAQKSESSGLQNMKSRATLIKASYELSSEIDQGTRLLVNCPY